MLPLGFFMKYFYSNSNYEIIYKFKEYLIHSFNQGSLGLLFQK